jgi:hypothetical protein
LIVYSYKIFFCLSSVDATVLRVDDIYQRETQNRVVLQNLDWRLQRLEDLNMNMYDIMQKLLSSQSLDEQNLSYMFDNDIRKRQRRRSSITEYELNYVKNKPLPKSTTMINRFSMLKPHSSITDRVSLSKKPVRLERQSTIRRLNSFPDDDSNISQIQSNEYTSITDS